MSNRKVESRKSRARKVRAPGDAIPQKPETIQPNFRVIGLLAFAGTLLFVLLTLYLLEGPDSARQSGTAPGGESTVRKTAPPSDRQTQAPEPPARAADAAPPAPVAPRPAAPAPVRQQVAEPEMRSVAVAISEPEPVMPVAAEEPVMPVVPEDPAVMSQATRPLPSRLDEALAAGEQSPAPLPEQRPTPVSEPQPDAAEPLPWQIQTQSPPPQESVVASIPRQSAVGSVRLPSRSDLKGWIRSTAREFVGGVDADGLPLYRFDLWLDAPPEVRSQIRQVSYEYLAPSAQPPLQDSKEADTGFRVKFGAASCAEKARITVTMIDGNERRVAVDGCRILN